MLKSRAILLLISKIGSSTSGYVIQILSNKWTSCWIFLELSSENVCNTVMKMAAGKCSVRNSKSFWAPNVISESEWLHSGLNDDSPQKCQLQTLSILIPHWCTCSVVNIVLFCWTLSSSQPYGINQWHYFDFYDWPNMQANIKFNCQSPILLNCFCRSI